MTTPKKPPPPPPPPGVFDKIAAIKKAAQARNAAGLGKIAPRAASRVAAQKAAGQQISHTMAVADERRTRAPRTSARHHAGAYRLYEMRPQNWRGALVEQVTACVEQTNGTFELLLWPSGCRVVSEAKTRGDMRATQRFLEEGRIVFSLHDYDEKGQLTSALATGDLLELAKLP